MEVSRERWENMHAQGSESGPLVSRDSTEHPGFGPRHPHAAGTQTAPLDQTRVSPGVAQFSLFIFLRKLSFDIGIKMIPETALPSYQFYVLPVVRKYFQLRE